MSSVVRSAYKRVVLPFGRRAGPEQAGRPVRRLIQFEHGEPGIKIGR